MNKNFVIVGLYLGIIAIAGYGIYQIFSGSRPEKPAKNFTGPVEPVPHQESETVNA